MFQQQQGTQCGSRCTKKRTMQRREGRKGVEAGSYCKTLYAIFKTLVLPPSELGES